MPETEPRAVVEQLVAAINAHDLPACARLMADDVHLVAATGRTLDLAGMGRLLASTLRALPDASVRVERWVVEGNTVVTEEVLEGTHEGTFAGLPASGRRLAIPMVHVTCVRDGRIVERRTYHDTAAVLRQLEDATAS